MIMLARKFGTALGFLDGLFYSDGWDLGTSLLVLDGLLDGLFDLVGWELGTVLGVLDGLLDELFALSFVLVVVDVARFRSFYRATLVSSPIIHCFSSSSVSTRSYCRLAFFHSTLRCRIWR